MVIDGGEAQPSASDAIPRKAGLDCVRKVAKRRLRSKLVSSEPQPVGHDPHWGPILGIPHATY